MLQGVIIFSMHKLQKNYNLESFCSLNATKNRPNMASKLTSGSSLIMFFPLFEHLDLGPFKPALQSAEGAYELEDWLLGKKMIWGTRSFGKKTAIHPTPLLWRAPLAVSGWADFSYWRTSQTHDMHTQFVCSYFMDSLRPHMNKCICNCFPRVPTILAPTCNAGLDLATDSWHFEGTSGQIEETPAKFCPEAMNISCARTFIEFHEPLWMHIPFRGWEAKGKQQIVELASVSSYFDTKTIWTPCSLQPNLHGLRCRFGWTRYCRQRNNRHGKVSGLETRVVLWWRVTCQAAVGRSPSWGRRARFSGSNWIHRKAAWNAKSVSRCFRQMCNGRKHSCMTPLEVRCWL